MRMSVVMGIVLLFSFITVLANLITDIVYALFDPRIQYS